MESTADAAGSSSPAGPATARVTAYDPTGGPGGAARAALARLADLLPHGRSLPDEVWAVRHRWVVVILALQAAGLPVFALSREHPLGHALLDGLVPAAMAAIACLPRLGRGARSSVAGVGLMVVSGVLVHLSAGAIEAHFTSS